MQQSSVIFANLIIAYLFFITMKGELPTYITLLRGGGQQTGGSGAAGGVGSGTNDVVSGAEALLNNSSNFDVALPELGSFGL